MKVFHWCMLGVTILLLLCEIAISQLCNSLIILVDGFHTLFIIMRMAVTPHQTTNHVTLDSSGPPSLPVSLPTTPPIKPPPDTQTGADGSPVTAGPPALGCGLRYSSCRVHSVRVFISALVLASLCLSYILEIIGFYMEPHAVQRPLLLMAVSAFSLLHKMLISGFNWAQQQAPESDSHLEVNHKVLAEEEAKGQPVPCGVGQLRSAVDNSLHNGALVFCNPQPFSLSDAATQTPQPQAEVHHAAEAPGDRAEHDQNATNAAPVCKPAPLSRGLDCLPSFVLIILDLCTSLLALINSLVILLIGIQCLHSHGPCSLLVYLDPSLSLLAVVTMIASVTPQLHRYGLLLLQATPPQVCVSDLGQRIASVPGVEAVHDLHIWQLTESFMVASVHVHCHAGFPAHRCADLMSGVTRVLQSAGVNCCTVQPEFASGPAASDSASPVVLREECCLPPAQACSLACGKACAGSMCCSPLEEGAKTLPEPLFAETKEEPQTLVIENTFL